MRVLLASLTLAMLASCGSSSSSSKTYVNPHAQAHAQMHQELYQEELTKEVQKRLDELSGTYKGTLPCSECDGIEFELVLNTDLTYVAKASYLGNKDETEEKNGSYVLTEEWKVKLDQYIADFMYFQLEDGKMRVLDKDGLVITGESAENYLLQPSDD